MLLENAKQQQKENLLYEIRYRNILTDFHNFLYLYKSPQTRMVAAFLKIATS